MAITKIYHELALRVFHNLGQQKYIKQIAEIPPPPSPPPKTFPLIPKILNGGIAGIVGISIVYPLDLVKTRLQNQSIGPNGEKQYKNIIDCFKQSMKPEGYFGLYRGSLVNIILVTPEKGFKFAANDFFRFHLTLKDGTLPLSSQAVAGAMAGLFQCFVVAPMDMIKIQMQDAGRIHAQATSEGKKIKHIRASELIRKLLRERGIFGMFKGIGPTAGRDISSGMFYFPLIAYVDDLGPAKPGQKQPFWWSLVAGIGVGSAAAVIANPFDVIKTRMQTLTKGKGDRHYTSSFNCFTETLKHEGPTAFLKGSICRIIVLGPLYGITQAVYFFAVAEQLLEFFHR